MVFSSALTLSMYMISATRLHLLFLVMMYIDPLLLLITNYFVTSECRDEQIMGI